MTKQLKRVDWTRYFTGEVFALACIFVFIFVNWIHFCQVEKLGSPDYYTYHFASQQLFSGYFKLGFTPPLFPFLLGLLGRIIHFIGYHGDSYILAGRLISLLSGFGVIVYSYRLLKTFNKQVALFAITFLAISPIYLKLLCFPQTDMLFLFFVVAAFYYMFTQPFKLAAIWPVLGGLLTRYEGILLLVAALIAYFKFKWNQKKLWAYIISFLATAGLTWFFLINFAPRLFKKINVVFSQGHLFYFLKSPQNLAYIIYNSILYFIPTKFPSGFKWSMLFALLILFFIGLFYLFKIKRQLGVAILFYLIVFIVFKGYTHNINPDTAFRRLLSPLWIIVLIAMIGIYYMCKTLKISQKLKMLILSLLLAVPVIIVINLPVIKGNSILMALLLLPAIFVAVIEPRSIKVNLIAGGIILLLFCAQLYYQSYKNSYRYVKAVSNKAAFAVANWLNGRDDGENVLIYSHDYMVKYYLKRPVCIKYIYIKNEKIYPHEDQLLAEFLRRVQRQEVKFVIFDMYLNYLDRPWLVALKKILQKESRNGSHFRVKKHLTYKGRYVATVLEPIVTKM